MTEDQAIEEAGSAESPELHALRRKIGWICHGARLAALLYAVWVLYLTVAYWTNAAAIKSGYGHMLDKDLSGMQLWQQAAALGLHLAIWLFIAASCYSGWRLFTAYLAGSIITAELSRWLRRTASFGLIAQLLAVAARPLVTILLTLHFPAGQHERAVQVFFQPSDLLTLLLLSVFLALAQVHMTAANIASEHRQIV